MPNVLKGTDRRSFEAAGGPSTELLSAASGEPEAADLMLRPGGASAAGSRCAGWT
jgi:hypothetical protein